MRDAREMRGQMRARCAGRCMRDRARSRLLLGTCRRRSHHLQASLRRPKAHLRRRRRALCQLSRGGGSRERTQPAGQLWAEGALGSCADERVAARDGRGAGSRQRELRAQLRKGGREARQLRDGCGSAPWAAGRNTSEAARRWSGRRVPIRAAAASMRAPS